MREKKCGIYMLTNMVTGKKYIGQSRDIVKRIYHHKYDAARNKPMKISKAIAEYGMNNFKSEILIECSLDELDKYEKEFIDKYNPEYNLNRGGRKSYICCRRLTDEEKEVCRQAAKKQWADLSEERKAYVKQYQLIGPRKGHPVSASTREKIRQANLGKKQSEETKAKRSAKLRGMPRKNKHHWKSVRCVETGEIFPRVKDAALAIGVDASCLTGVLKGRRKSTGGFHWEYVL